MGNTIQAKKQLKKAGASLLTFLSTINWLAKRGIICLCGTPIFWNSNKNFYCLYFVIWNVFEKNSFSPLSCIKQKVIYLFHFNGFSRSCTKSFLKVKEAVKINISINIHRNIFFIMTTTFYYFAFIITLTA